jgi:Ca2+-binding EF-hand superfamily protein
LLQHLRVSDLLHMLDRNHDGKVSRQELKKWLEGRLIPSCTALGRHSRDYTFSRTFRRLGTAN